MSVSFISGKVYSTSVDCSGRVMDISDAIKCTILDKFKGSLESYLTQSKKLTCCTKLIEQAVISSHGLGL